MEKIALDTNPNSNLHYELYQSRSDSILGLVQISHGMAEHKGRYKEFINFLNLNGFHVAIHDHRGHGERIFEDKIGFLIKRMDGIWLLMICLIYILIQIKDFQIYKKSF